MHAVLIDTEGLGSCQRDVTQDMKIFSLALLLSSYFLYNCMSAIDEAALESLSLVCNLSKHVHISAKPSNIAETLEPKYFPQFMWVVRDFALQMVDENDNEINAKQYLENALRPTDVDRDVLGDNADLVLRKNEIRQVL